VTHFINTSGCQGAGHGTVRNISAID